MLAQEGGRPLSCQVVMHAAGQVEKRAMKRGLSSIMFSDLTVVRMPYNIANAHSSLVLNITKNLISASF